MGKKLKQLISLDQAQLPFGSRNGGGLAAHPWERRAIAVIGLFLVLLSVVYVYSVMTSVMHVAAREELSREATRLSAEVARLEAQYLSRTESITESWAREHGYVSLAERTFVGKIDSLSLGNR